MSRSVSVERTGLSRWTLLSTFLRSLMVQGSWNYRTMLGSGFAFALLPGLRQLHSGDPRAVRRAVERHLEHFNAHPYLAAVAIGAILRLEAENADPDTVRKLKIALQGPLGSLGDALVWATVLPAAALGALALLWMGVPAGIAVTLFLLVFNALHLGLRLWGFRAGIEAGRDVGRLLSEANLSGWTRRLEPVVVVLLGALVGAVIGGDRGLLNAGVLWLVLATGAFVAGLWGGHRTWRPAAAVTVAVIGVLSLAGVLT